MKYFVLLLAFLGCNTCHAQNFVQGKGESVAPLFLPDQGEAADAYSDAFEMHQDASGLWDFIKQDIMDFIESFGNGDISTEDAATATELLGQVEVAAGNAEYLKYHATQLYSNSEGQNSNQSHWTACWSFATYTYYPAADAFLAAVEAIFEFIDSF